MTKTLRPILYIRATHRPVLFVKFQGSYRAIERIFHAESPTSEHLGFELQSGDLAEIRVSGKLLRITLDQESSFTDEPRLKKSGYDFA